MRIGTRMTVTAALLVAAVLGIYGFVRLTTLRSERTRALQLQAEEMAESLRASIEAVGFRDFMAHAPEFYERFQSTLVPWEVKVRDFREIPPQPTTDPAIERLRKLKTVEQTIVEESRQGGRTRFVYLLPIRETAETPRGYRLVGAVEVSRDLSVVDSDMADARTSIFISMVLLIVVIVLAISVLARRTITRPIDKLIAGIDDVTRGDLSHVVLQEREDEIGILAARFNDMTASLREAREETRRGLEAKLALEDQLRHTEKLATIGQLAAEIAHEVGTPLNVVTGRARAMAKKAEDPEAVKKNAGIVAEQAARITRIIQRLLDFARRGAAESRSDRVDVNRLCRDTLEFLEHQVQKAGVTPILIEDQDLALVPGSRDQLQQVLLNLFVNAIQAMPSGGELRVATSRTSRRRPGLEMAPEQDYAVLEIADTGGGIPAAEREKIFEPFYTSRSADGGTGLGLAVAHGIVKEHDGWIEIDENTSHGHGTVFRVFLPTAEGAAQPARAAQA